MFSMHSLFCGVRMWWGEDVVGWDGAGLIALNCVWSQCWCHGMAGVVGEMQGENKLTCQWLKWCDMRWHGMTMCSCTLIMMMIEQYIIYAMIRHNEDMCTASLILRAIIYIYIIQQKLLSNAAGNPPWFNDKRKLQSVSSETQKNQSAWLWVLHNKTAWIHTDSNDARVSARATCVITGNSCSLCNPWCRWVPQLSRFWFWILLGPSFLQFLQLLLIFTLDAGGFPSCPVFGSGCCWVLHFFTFFWFLLLMPVGSLVVRFLVLDVVGSFISSIFAISSDSYSWCQWVPHLSGFGSGCCWVLHFFYFFNFCWFVLLMPVGSPVVPFLVLDVVGFFVSSISSDFHFWCRWVFGSGCYWGLHVLNL